MVDMSEEEEVEVIASTAAESSTNQSPMYRGPDADLQSADVSFLHELIFDLYVVDYIYHLSVGPYKDGTWG